MNIRISKYLLAALIFTHITAIASDFESFLGSPAPRQNRLSYSEGLLGANNNLLYPSSLGADGSFLDGVVGAVLVGAIIGTAFGMLNKATYKACQKRNSRLLGKFLCRICNPLLLLFNVIEAEINVPLIARIAGGKALCLTAIAMERLIYYDKIRLPFYDNDLPKDNEVVNAQPAS